MEISATQTNFLRVRACVVSLFLIVHSIFSARSENAVLQKLVVELKEEVKILKLKNASLEAEVEMYRAEIGGKIPENLGQLTSTNGHNTSTSMVDSPFFQSGNGVYCKYQGIILKDAHGLTNPLCLSLAPKETIVCSGGADGVLLLYQWGAISSQGILPDSNRAEVSLSAPVIGVAATKNMAAASCMDGSIHVVKYSDIGGRLKIMAAALAPRKHSKFCKNVLWSKDLVVSAAADGDVHLQRVRASGPLDEESTVSIEHWKSLHLGAAVEAACMYQNKLIIYTRETNFLIIVDLEEDLLKSKVSLNEGVAGGFSEHVSFAVLDLKIHGKYLACATDANRHIIIDTGEGNHSSQSIRPPSRCIQHTKAFVECKWSISILQHTA